MSKRFALIDNPSGYYYGAFNADDAIGACRAIEEELPHPEPVDFERTYELASNESGWIVYEMPADFDPDDDMDCDVERKTNAVLRASLSRAGLYRVIKVDPDAERAKADWIAACEASNN